LGCARVRTRSSPWPRPSGGRDQLPESKDPGPPGSGSGCKSPAGRRGSGDWSAGRSAASRDGRRALIARSHDLPCPSRLAAARERPEYSGRAAGAAACGARGTRMRRFTYCPTPALTDDYPRRLRTEEGQRSGTEPFPGNGGGRPPFSSLSFPLRTASPTPVRSARKTNDRLPRASGGDRWLAMRER
jgi:hypothetical protein